MSSNNSYQINQKMTTKFSSFSCLALDEDSDNDNNSIKESPVQVQKEEKINEVQNLKNNIVIANLNQSIDSAKDDSWTSVTPSSKKGSKRTTYAKKTFDTSKYDKNKYEKKYVKKSESKEMQLSDEKEELKLEQELVSTDEVLEDGDEMEDKNNEALLEEVHQYKFQNKWYIWIHEVDSKDWSNKSYKIIHSIETIKDFWEFFNSISKLNQWKYNFFIMKSNSHPTWEHSTNRNGGTCSVRIDISQSVDIIEQLAILLVNESLTEEINDINGVSFAAKGSWCVIKIWNRDNKNNISNQMPSYLRKIYPSISIKYKENIPEY
jgi:hypothetical protein